VRVTGARIGLLLSYDASSSAPGPGVELAVPAWFFTVADDAAEPAVIAIDPSFLAPPAQPEPTNGPDGLPGSGSDGSPGSVTGGTPTSPYPPPASPTSPHT
jgi:hypothetical protein